MTLRRPLGKTGLAIAPLGLGGHVFGWTVDEATSWAILDRFVDEGFNLIDTADIYGRFWMGVPGLSESIIGRCLKRSGRRSSVLLATKVGGLMGPAQSGLSAQHILASVEGSLQRLGVEQIDLYQSHLDDTAIPLEETLTAYAALLRAGKIRAIGTSNFTAPRLARALQLSAKEQLPPYQTLQPKYNLYERTEFEGSLAALCQQEQLGVICYGSLASGFLTGKYGADATLAPSKRRPEVEKFLNPRGFRIIAALLDLAARYEATPAQIALAWLLTRPGLTAPITSATSVDQLISLLAATRLHLDAAALAQLDRASAP